MDEATFQAELKSYKVVRRADFHKVYYNKKYMEQHKHGVKAQAKKTGATAQISPKPVSADSSVGFWELLEKSLKGTMTPVEINKFLACLRQEHGRLHEKVNLTELDAIAARCEAE